MLRENLKLNLINNNIEVKFVINNLSKIINLLTNLKFDIPLNDIHYCTLSDLNNHMIKDLKTTDIVDFMHHLPLSIYETLKFEDINTFDIKVEILKMIDKLNFILNHEVGKLNVNIYSDLKLKYNDIIILQEISKTLKSFDSLIYKGKNNGLLGDLKNFTIEDLNNITIFNLFEGLNIVSTINLMQNFIINIYHEIDLKFKNNRLFEDLNLFHDKY